jgi:8-oxo-dGTP diphosphatase
MVLIAVALVRRGEQVLLVRQQGPDDPQPNWALPGGVVEPGELVTEALVRELREETGLELLDPGRLLYTVQTTDSADSWVALVFETDACRGDILCADPDGLVNAAEFVDRATALERLAALSWLNMREPVMAYLRGEVGAGAIWMYRREGSEFALDTVIGKTNLPGL